MLSNYLLKIVTKNIIWSWISVFLSCIHFWFYRNSSVVTMQPFSAMWDLQVWPYRQIWSSSSSSSSSSSRRLHHFTDMFYPIESSLLSIIAPSSSSSDENSQIFTLRVPSELKTTTQVVALDCCWWSLSVFSFDHQPEPFWFCWDQT